MNSNYMIEFGKTVRKSRTELGITQEELAELVNSCCITIRKIEQGKGNANWKLCTMLCIVLNIDLDFLNRKNISPYLNERIRKTQIEVFINSDED